MLLIPNAVFLPAKKKAAPFRKQPFQCHAAR